MQPIGTHLVKQAAGCGELSLKPVLSVLSNNGQVACRVQFEEVRSCMQSMQLKRAKEPFDVLCCPIDSLLPS